MRVLAVYSQGLKDLLDPNTLPRTKHDIVSYGEDPAADLHWSSACSSYQELIAMCPAGWKPDAAVFGSIEYSPVPRGVEYAECLTVGIVGDWNVGAQSYTMMGGAFDALIADRAGCERLKRAGFPNVFYTPIWGFNPLLHRTIPGIERDLDIVMVGNLNYNIQRERTRWLARVARLSDRYRVCVTVGVFGEEYVRLQNRARIVFNRSVRGELNMRAFEAAACGALMFYERENREIEDLFRDRVECVLYDDSDLEEHLDFYLTHEEERAQIAEAGWRRVQTETDAYHIERLLDGVDAERPSILSNSSRSFLSLPRLERSYCRGFQLAATTTAPIHSLVEPELLNSAVGADQRPEIANLLGCASAEFGDRGKGQGPAAAHYSRALAHLREACRCRPDYIAAHLNTTLVMLKVGDPQAVAFLERTLALLDADRLRPDQLRGPYYPRQFDHPFVSELERVWAEHRPESSGWVAAMKDLLLWRVLEMKSDLALQAGDPKRAKDAARRAVALRPEIGTTRCRLALAHDALREWSVAEAEYRATLEDSPFSADVWERLGNLLIETGQIEACAKFLNEREAIIRGCPHLEYWLPTLNALRSRCSAPGMETTRLLAHVDWTRPEHWESLIRIWSSQFGPEDPVMLLLTVEATRVQSAVTALEAFADSALGRSCDSMADITLLPFQEGEQDAVTLGAEPHFLVAFEPYYTESRGGAAHLLPLLPVAQVKRDTVLAHGWLRF